MNNNNNDMNNNIDEQQQKSSNNNSNVSIGPDLNPTKSTLDKKLYRQIILSNGLRVILISDTLALHQEDYYYEDDEDEEDGGEEDEEEEKKDDKDEMIQNSNSNDNEGDDDNDEDDNSNDNEDDDEEEEEEEEDDGLRKAAAAILVGAGSFHDPPHAQGLAHFLEHMLFMGSQKYPGENQYDSFLSKHSGSDNAYTELEYTLYHFEVCQDQFFVALDMLAQFFVCPLMKGEAVERELNSIESEFMLSKNSDECRLQQLYCHECCVVGDGDSDGCGIGIGGGHTTMNTTNSNEEDDSSSMKKKKKHPFGTFSWGNIQSLKTIPEQNGINMMKELRKFYNHHYYAQNMSLVVIGGYTLDELQKRVIESFSEVPALPRVMMDDDDDDDEVMKTVEDNVNDKNDFYKSMTIQRQNGGTWNQRIHTPIKEFGMPFNNHSLGHVYRIVPVKDKHTLNITWQIPPQWSNWKSKPVDYISHLLGHEGKGSLLSALKAKSYVNGCYAGVGSGGYENASSHALFCMTFTLSENGVSHWVEIVHYVYIYIGMIRYYCESDDDDDDGLPMWIYDELKAIQDLAYRFADEEQPVDLVETIAESLVPYHELPPERLLDGDSLLFEFDGNAIKDLVDNYLTPHNSRVDITSSTFGRAADYEQDVHNEEKITTESVDTESVAVDFTVANAGKPFVEPIFGTQYWSHSIPEHIMVDWSEASMPQLPPNESKIDLPPVNPFIPKAFDLKPLPADDSHHPLLFCSLKLCISVGKKKAWFPCTVNKYDGTKNRALLVYEDEDEKWHKLDGNIVDYSSVATNPNFEGTMDGKSIKFKVISVPKDGEGATLKYGDESDWHIDDGIHYPHVPPPLPESRLPQLVHNTKLLKLWHLQDRKFKRPTAELRLKFACQTANKTPLHRACAELLTKVFHDATTETSYLANVCELGNSLRATDFGFTLRVNGFDDKLLHLTEALLEVFFSFNTDNQTLPQGIHENRFDACLEILRRRYNNEGMKASSLCSEVRLRCIRPTIWSANSKTEAIKDLSIAKFMEISASLFKSFSIEGLYLGNVDTNDANNAVKLISTLISSCKGMEKKKHPKQEVLIVNSPKSASHHVIVPTIDPNEPNTAIEIYIQCGKDNIEDRVLIDMLVQILYEPLFDQLRTKEQLGYQVSCDTRWTFGIMGISFRVVTTAKSANDVNERIEQFLRDYREELVKMSKETFMEHLVGLAKTKLEKYNSLEEEAGNLWYEILENRYDWEVYRNEAHALRSITKDQVIKAFDIWLCPSNNSRRRLIVHAIGTKEGESSRNRPVIPPEDVGKAIDERVKEFHKATGNKTWGKIF